MKCGRLRGTRADKKVQIGKSEQDPSHFYSFLPIPSAQSFSFFIYPLDSSSAAIWSNLIDCLGDPVKARR